jgi:putative MATE family efflux protein
LSEPQPPAPSPKTPSDQTADAADRLGVEPVGKLLFRFSLPAITGMLVNALYNVVDRIFVGRGVGEIALGGLSLVMPLMTLSLAFAMLFGLGAANMLSMRLGQGRRPEAENALNHAVWLLAGIGILLSVVEYLLLNPLLSLMGAEEGSRALGYARDYYRIILLGQPFLVLGFGLSHCTRAQGFPAVAMVGMFIGAIMNIILDPIFIFLFHMGVEGAAIATIISQLASLIWILAFIGSPKAVVRMRLKPFKPSPKIILDIIAFGSAQFFLQLAMSVVQLIYNNSIGRYGASSLGVTGGGDIALSGLNIINSVLMLILMPIFGINQGAQPILGYNYGAAKYQRVLKALTQAILASTVICTIGFIAAQLFSAELIRFFNPQGSEALFRFAPWAMKVITIFLPLTGFQIVSANMFVVTGRPKTAIILSMLRQVIILIPCIILFGRFWGLWGIVYAGPTADVISIIITGIMIIIEIKKLRSAARAQSGESVLEP